MPLSRLRTPSNILTRWHLRGMLAPPEVGSRGVDSLSDLMARWAAGDEAAFNSLVSLVYDELRRLAHRRLGHQHGDPTLNTTALVHETYMRLAGHPPREVNDRHRFFALAATVMRSVLVDHARERLAAKRNAGIRLELSPDMLVTNARDVELLSLDRALNALALLDERQSRIIELRFFAGLSIEDTAEILGMSPATVKRDWVTARAWLHDSMSRGERPTKAASE